MSCDVAKRYAGRRASAARCEGRGRRLQSSAQFGDQPDPDRQSPLEARRWMMPGRDAGVSRMLETYRDLIRRFVIGDISADEFETDYLVLFKDDPNQVTGEEFDILDGLFADVDDYVSDPI